MTDTGADRAARLQARYGDASALPDDAPWNATIDLLLAHRSVRAFDARPLPPGTLEMLAAAAQSASTSSNLQAFSLVAVEDPARRARLSALARDQAHVREAPLFLAWVADLARIAALGDAQGTRAEGLEYLEALMIAVIDAALAAQNAAVALESIGLGCCYVGALRNRPLEVAAELALPQGTIAMFGLCVGYPDPARPAAVKPRLPQPAILHREQYGAEGQSAAVAAYDRLMRGFYGGQGLPQADWSNHVLRRLASASTLHGRERLVEILQQRGFRLR